ncbi:MAG: transcription termination factor NusA [Dehalococcoidales bacterium]|nr:transcription termination factor NusA [Dehalococcoidales bacterium]
MKSDFLLAITQLSAEKKLPREVVVAAVESALVSAYRKDNFTPTQDIAVKINPGTGKVEVWAEKVVVELLVDDRREISLDDARRIKSDIQIGETIMVESTPHNAGRIAAQTAKQVILQRLHEAEHSAIFNEYADKEGDILTGVVQRIEARQIILDLNRTEALLPVSEQMHNERYRVGQRLKVCLLEVAQNARGPQLIVSRSHSNLLRRLFELEIPEIFNGIVEIKSIAREAGYRSKVAVSASQDGIDPVGCCVGLRGIRIQNIVNELNGEKIDVVMWDPSADVLIANALSPAQVLSVELSAKDKVATVIIPDRQLSLAIGKEGQNVRLAAKLTDWHIDIKSASSVEEERALKEESLPEVEEEVVIDEPMAEITDIIEPITVEEEITETIPLDEEMIVLPSPVIEPQKEAIKSKLRFAEDIMIPKSIKPDIKLKKKKKKGPQGKDRGEDGLKLKKQRRVSGISVDEDEDYEY